MIFRRNRQLIVRLKGGLGNQLFGYAAAKRLAHINNCELVIDHLSGFARDKKHKRQYELGNFTVSARIANRKERIEPFARIRKSFARKLARRQKFGDRSYIFQEQTEFDSRLLEKKITKFTYIDGHWQSEKYFSDISNIIRREFDIQGTIPSDYKKLQKAIVAGNAVMVHVRWFNAKDSEVQTSNLQKQYYTKAIEYMCENVHDPLFFLFSDDLEAAYEIYKNYKIKIIPVSDYVRNPAPHLDLWAMSLCKHFILANSTFSWWGAWLSTNETKNVVCPIVEMQGGSTHEASWNFDGLIPEDWIKM